MVYTYIDGIPEEKYMIGIQQLHQHVFEGAELSLEELHNKHNLLTCLAISNDEVIGFKMGYELSPDIFYSWLGGVHSSSREQGIASKLMALQHKLLKNAEYKTVQTKSRNTRKEMLILNIKHGFDIISTYTSAKGKHKIILEKDL